MARFCPLFSGSAGNAYLIGGSGGNILIDAGVSAKRIENALKDLEVEPSAISAIFITHEHTDHVGGLRVFASRHKIRVYSREGTLAALEESGNLARVAAESMPEKGVEAAGMYVTSFETPHDCRQSCGYRISLPDGRKIAVATDIGIMTDEIRVGLCGCDLVVLESNHDVRMLQNSSYPYNLKRRILSDIGHLSNESCANELPKLIETGTTRIVLGHLSRENNMPMLAYQTSLSILEHNSMKQGRDYMLSVASPTNESGITIFKRGVLLLSVHIICVGKLKEKYWVSACAEYAKRLGAYCKFSIDEIEEYRLNNAPSEGEISVCLKNEGNKILNKIPANAKVYALCIEGKGVSSQALAKSLETDAVMGKSNIVFVIGGSYGLSEQVKQRADFKLSMSDMTFPHQLARVMLCEQVYRAFSIINDGKYHK